MRKFLNKYIQNKYVKKIRVIINYKPKPVELKNINESYSVSDAFIWRTDKGFNTIFKFKDIPNFFYNINSSAYISFFNKENINIKNIFFKELSNINELQINEKFLNNIKDYGTFYIYHKSNFKKNPNIILSNRCYVGYYKNNQMPCYVHGNTLVKSFGLNSENFYSNFVQKSPLFEQNYFIQNNFFYFDKTELCICNPTSEKIIFKINSQKYELMPWNMKIIEQKKNVKLINIKSKCLFLRPIIFNYKNEFFDVYHG